MILNLEVIQTNIEFKCEASQQMANGMFSIM